MPRQQPPPPLVPYADRHEWCSTRLAKIMLDEHNPTLFERIVKDRVRVTKNAYGHRRFLVDDLVALKRELERNAGGRSR